MIRNRNNFDTHTSKDGNEKTSWPGRDVRSGYVTSDGRCGYHDEDPAEKESPPVSRRLAVRDGKVVVVEDK